MKMLKTLCFSFLLLAAATHASGAIVLFDLQGKAGAGLIGGNENGTVNGTPGVGGEVGAGISFDDVSKMLTINVGWGLGDGFSTNLTGNASAMHIHGPGNFTTNAGVTLGLDGLGGFSNLANGGGFNGTVALNATQEGNLLAGLLYINVHTATNSGGEIRGNLVAVPEPSRAVLGMMGIGFLAFRRSRKAHIAA